MSRASLLDPKIPARRWLAAGYLAIQALLVFTAGARPDGVFSFQMFNESSRIAITLGRRVPLPDGGTTVLATDGSWDAVDTSGAVRHFRWADRVRDPILSTLGRPVHASYGVSAQLFRLQNALEDAASHLEGDLETRAIVADVRIWRNGRESYETRLESPVRKP